MLKDVNLTLPYIRGAYKLIFIKDEIYLQKYEYYQWKMNTLCIISQNPEYVKTHCNDRKNPLDFACRKWYL